MLFLCLMSTLCMTPENKLSASELGPAQSLFSNEMLCFLGHFTHICPWSTSEDVSSPELHSVIQHALIRKCKFETHISWFTGVQSIMSGMWNKILEGSKQRKETLHYNREHLLLMHIFGQGGIFEILPLQNLFWTSDTKLNLREKFHQGLPLKPRNVKAVCVTVDIHILQQLSCCCMYL